MPVVVHLEGLKFFFFSNEGHPLEPAHIHVRSGWDRDEAKFWLSSRVPSLQSRFRRALHQPIQRLVEAHRDQLEEAWNEHFSQNRAVRSGQHVG